MRRLLNTLYITNENSYLTLEGENVVINTDNKETSRYPLHILEGIVSFSYRGASTALIGKCAEKGIQFTFCSPNGKFLARAEGCNNGNVLLRREQYRLADDPVRAGSIASMLLVGKVFNARWILERAIRDHSMRIDVESVRNASQKLRRSIEAIRCSTDLESLRGIEGEAASTYFHVFDQIILRNKDTFTFEERTRRPPRNPCNALLSFVYMLLSGMCKSALESVGLDSYVGFLHKDRPGRTSLSLDLMEELRPCMADRFVVTIINNQIVSTNDFQYSETGEVSIADKARKELIKSWQERKQVMISHPFLKEKIPWGLVPFIQAQLMARYIRGDLEKYPPFLWK